MWLGSSALPWPWAETPIQSPYERLAFTAGSIGHENVQGEQTAWRLVQSCKQRRQSLARTTLVADTDAIGREVCQHVAVRLEEVGRLHRRMKCRQHSRGSRGRQLGCTQCLCPLWPTAASPATSRHSKHLPKHGSTRTGSRPPSVLHPAPEGADVKPPCPRRPSMLCGFLGE